MHHGQPEKLSKPPQVGRVMTRARRSLTLPWAAALGLLIAVSSARAGPGQGTATRDAAGTPPYLAVTDIHQTMAWIVDPAADVIWDSAGTVITAQGSAELAPTTEEGWAVVLHAAATLTEAGNLLMMPGRVAGDDWIVWAQQLVATGKLAIDAAEAQDADALFNAGGEIYQVCRGCHEQFWVEIPAPTASAQP